MSARRPGGQRSGTRMFAAIVPPADAVEHLDSYLEPRREHGPFRWSAPEQLHLTVAFLEAVPDRVVDDLVEGLESAAARRTGFSARIAGGGAFPDPARARVLYAGVEPGAAPGVVGAVGAGDEAGGIELDRLAGGCRTAAARAGLVVDGRRFRPHVTVARLAQPIEATRWVRVLEAYRGPVWTVDHVALVASYLGEGPRRRPRYETVAELPLGG